MEFSLSLAGFCDMSALVRVHVYDLSMGMAAQLSASLIGTRIEIVPHTGVVVFGREFFFSGGIAEADPSFFAASRGIPVCRSIELGSTEVPEELFREFLEERSQAYTAESYVISPHPLRAPLLVDE